MGNAARAIYLNKHALKPPVAGKLAVRHTSSQKTSCQTDKFVCLTASFLDTGGFVKIFLKFFHDYSYFFKFHDFSMYGTFFLDT